MSEQTPFLRIVSETELNERQAAGLLAPLHAGEGVEEIDCGDDRGLTIDAAEQRQELYGRELIIPGRMFGAAGGFALASLVTIGGQSGEKAVRDVLDSYGPNPVVAMAADISTRADQLFGINLNQHSDDTKEGNPLALAVAEAPYDELGCRFLAAAGGVIALTADPANRRDIIELQQTVGSAMPASEALDGARAVGAYVPPTFGVTRKSLHSAVTNPDTYAPIAIVSGSHAPNNQTAVVMDLAGYRSHAESHIADGIPRYHHTPRLAADLLPQLLPEHRLDPQLLEASAYVLGMATRTALSGAGHHDLRVEIIPADYRAA